MRGTGTRPAVGTVRPVALRFYDTSTRSVRDFVPLEAGRAGIYLCGATVQAPPHVGHIRSGVAFDVIRRWLTAKGLDVTFVRNVTDIDDKIIHNAGHEDVPYWVIAMRNERAFTRAYDALGCLPPTYEPRATGHIPEIVALMQRLIDSGHGYAAGGDVYFDVRSFPGYGALSGQRIDDMLAASDSEALAKRDPRDFAMWKSAKPGEPLWETPWGPGRPGWHIECSAMAEKYLGASFDIHGGGVDLVFPHHENEIAQSKAAGDGFANYWLHNAWVTTSGEKMSKSLGNSLLVDQVLTRVRPVELRYYLAGSHYRSMQEYSDESVADAGQGYRRIEGFLTRAAERLSITGDPTVRADARPAAFDDAMDDDIGVPQALAVLHDSVRRGNAALAASDADAARVAFDEVVAMVDVLGLNPWAQPWVSGTKGTAGRETEVIDALVQVVLAQRQDARARKDFAAADAIRDGLDRIGIRVEDTPQGVRWSLDD
ncbi:MAG: cysteinyl-tRNA synthetase [Actinomycetota bacterium]|nr:cysteinyl-tRNA synthetase [Actinomycetota bacterium]